MKTTGTDTLGFLIHDAARLMRRRFEQRADAYGLSAAQFRLLAHLVKSEGAPQARLAALLEIEPISVSRLLDRMEAGGWIERRADATDRRVRMIFPTARSRDVFVEIKAVAGQIYEEALAGMTREQRDATLAGLKAITNNLSDGDARSDNAQNKIEEGVGQ